MNLPVSQVPTQRVQEQADFAGWARKCSSAPLCQLPGMEDTANVIMIISHEATPVSCRHALLFVAYQEVQPQPWAQRFKLVFLLK